MNRAEELLGEADYKNYRNVRAVSFFFVLLGGVFAVGGISIATRDDLARKNRIDPALTIPLGLGAVVVGLAGAVGGVAALSGSRRWSMLVYVMAALYVFAFPLGTILSAVMFTGLRRYLDALEQLRADKQGP